MRGTVKWFDAKKGYGFIQCEGHEDIFVHYSSIRHRGFKTLDDGEEVEFEIITSDRGPQAMNVSRLGGGDAWQRPADDVGQEPW
jgi:CspA family cold shock protein